ncbi:MAG: hypothetical protein PUA62_10210 [Lachnospiraceae bacterium]|nr:hypothetical protein [Lachnospiraceae bacterium]
MEEMEKKEQTADTTEEKEQTEENNVENTSSEIRTVHGQRVGLEPHKEKDDGKKNLKTIGEKIGYFWDYYKWTVGVVVGLALCILLLVRAVIIEMKPPIIYIAMMNAHMESPGDATYGDDYGNQRGLDPKSGRITLDVDFLHPELITDADLKNDTIIASMQRFSASVTTGNIDIAITNPWVLRDYMENNVFHDLRDVYTEEELAQFGELLTYEKNASGEVVPVGIIINGHRDIDSFYEEGETIVIGIPSDSTRVERAKDFIAWMFEG